jgi:hypothetical protein
MCDAIVLCPLRFLCAPAGFKTPAFRSRHRASSSGEVLGMRASFRKGGKLEAEGRLSVVSLQRSQALTIDGCSLRWNAVSRSPERRSGSRRSGQQVHAFSIPYGLEGDAPPATMAATRDAGHEAVFSFMPAATRYEGCRAGGIGSHSMPSHRPPVAAQLQGHACWTLTADRPVVWC